MSKASGNQKRRSQSHKRTGAEDGTKRLAEYLTAALTVVLCAALVFYTSDGYYQIGADKFTAYRNVMLTGSAVLFPVLAVYAAVEIRERRRPRISVTDAFVLAYLILAGISVLAGGFYQDALWGFPGWNMGILSQIGFVILYVILSRFGRYYRVILAALCSFALIVYLLGVLNRLLIDPFGFYDGLSYLQTTQFLSTLGQSSWYGSFLAVTLPVGMAVFLYADSGRYRAAGALMTAAGFCTLVTQNSDSAYIGLAGALIVFGPLCAANRQYMRRFLTALTMFFASGKLMYFLMRFCFNPDFEPDYVTELMWTSPVTWALLFLCLIAAAALYVPWKHTDPWEPPKMAVRLFHVVPAAAVVAAAAAVCVLILQSKGLMPAPIAGKLENISYLNWGKEWGNGRGRIWSFGAKMFTETNLLHKLFGVGPDCFHSYVSSRYGAEQSLFWGDKQLTNAHNEWLTSLINVGIVGTAAYAGIYVTQIFRSLRISARNFLSAGIAAACVSYMLYNFFCYQQVLCTPYVFMLMGTGEYILRQAVDETPPNG